MGIDHGDDVLPRFACAASRINSAEIQAVVGGVGCCDSDGSDAFGGLDRDKADSDGS